MRQVIVRKRHAVKPISFDRNGWTCFVGPSAKYLNKRTFRAVRGEGRARQVINLEIHECQVADFDPQAYWSGK